MNTAVASLVFYKTKILYLGNFPHDLITSQRFHLDLLHSPMTGKGAKMFGLEKNRLLSTHYEFEENIYKDLK